MRSPWRDDFPLTAELVMLNHASYGLAPQRMLTHCAALRNDLESDPNVRMGEALQRRLVSIADHVAAELGLPDPASCALTTSATSGAAAVQCSLPLRRGDTVVILDCEYSSVIRGWRRRCEEVGARLCIVDVPLPLHDSAELLERMSRAAGDTATIVQFSAIASSAALLLPVNELASWGHERGATVVVDAAHAPFHVDVGDWQGVDVAFGTLHKWLPVPRSVGLLWSTTELAPLLRPAETSLTFDEPGIAARFGWPGTFDPAPRLALPAAIELYHHWKAVGATANCEAVADYADEALSAIGAVPTGGAAFRPPRMRAFLLAGVGLTELRTMLLDNNIRAWSGQYDASSCLLRVATHVYNDQQDIDMLAASLETVTTGR